LSGTKAGVNEFEAGGPHDETRFGGTDAVTPAERRPVALIVLDGWGYAEPGPANAISQADTPTMDRLFAEYPWVLLNAGGEAVGLPDGVMGNSEVGHLTLGTGRVVYQDLTRINKMIADGSFFDNPVLREAFEKARQSGGAVHLMGLLSDGGVHGDILHVEALVELAVRMGVEELYLHPFMDGRDTSPWHGRDLLKDLEAKLEEHGVGRIADVIGRYYAMDRDRRWERTKIAWDALVYREGLKVDDALAAIEASYEEAITDEFILPTVILGTDAALSDGDSVVFYNFRPDRARQLTRALIDREFAEFDRGPNPPTVHLVSFTQYEADFAVPVAFPDVEPKQVLAEVLSEHGLTQLHIAETEKYAHVTFFFNGGREDPYPGETRKLIPSPQEVATYDQKPEMSCHELADAFADIYRHKRPDFTVLNFANADMVGHSGNLEATIAAVEHVDHCLEIVLEPLLEDGAHIFVTADHGNAEYLREPDQSRNTAHTTNPVPLIYVDHGAKLEDGGGLADIAPTVLCLLGLPVPAEMTGTPLCPQRSKE